MLGLPRPEVAVFITTSCGGVSDSVRVWGFWCISVSTLQLSILVRCGGLAVSLGLGLGLKLYTLGGPSLGTGMTIYILLH